MGLLFLAQVLVGGATAHYRGRAGDILWFRSDGDLSDQPAAYVAFAACDLLDRNRLCRGRDFSRKHARREGAKATGRRGKPALRSTGSRYLRQPTGRDARHSPASREPLVLVRTPGVGIPRPRAGWQFLLAAGLLIWFMLIVRAVGRAKNEGQDREIVWLFLCSALAIPLFYLPALFFTSTTHFTVVDNWRFWIIHLWVEGFL